MNVILGMIMGVLSKGLNNKDNFIGDTTEKKFSQNKRGMQIQRYSELWKMPYCLKSLDGKHIRIKCFDSSASAN